MSATPQAFHISQHSARRMVRQLHHHSAEQRQTVMNCRNRAEALTAAGIAFSQSQNSSTKPPPLCFVEVASERDVKDNFLPDGTLSGIAVAVSDALDVQEFRTRSGLDTPMFHHEARKEFPLVSWLRRQGAQFVGKLSCRTPLALNEGCVFGPDKPAAVAVAGRACHYAISCSLNGPSSIACAVHHDVVGFKPTAQTFGTFTEQFKLSIPSMTLGLTASRVDDLLYLWQVYTSAIDPEQYFGAGAKPSEAKDAAAATDATDGHSDDSPSSAATGITTNAATSHVKGKKDVKVGDEVDPNDPVHGEEMPKYARPEILDHNPYNYTVKDRRGKIADIDVGWRDYNAEASFADDFGKTPRPGFVKRLVSGDRNPYTSPRVELAVGYPAEWIEKYSQSMYGTPKEFHKRLTDSIYYRSALHRNQKMEIIPVAFDFDIEDVIHACNIISHYELARAFDKLFLSSDVEGEGDAAGGRGTEVREEMRKPKKGDKAETVTLDMKAPAAPNRPNTFKAMTGVMEELPKEIVSSIYKGQKMTVADYNNALRTRDDVVRATEEQFQDVDAFVVPLLSEPYVTGNMRSIALTLPFHLAGNPILSVQMDKDLPVALVGELGRDAALLEDSFCFLQFVRGASPKWWRQKVFGNES